MRQPPDRQPQESECEARTQLLQHVIGLGAAGQRIRDQADFVAAGDLLTREIEDVTEKPAKRGAEHMDDPQRSSPSLLLGHRTCPFLPAIRESGRKPQKNRSRITIVSPGWTGWVIGTGAV